MSLIFLIYPYSWRIIIRLALLPILMATTKHHWLTYRFCYLITTRPIVAAIRRQILLPRHRRLRHRRPGLTVVSVGSSSMFTRLLTGLAGHKRFMVSRLANGMA